MKSTLVIDLAGAGEASVVQRTVSGFEVVSTVGSPQVRVRVDEALAERLVALAVQANGHDGSVDLSVSDRASVRASVRSVLQTEPSAAAVVLFGQAGEPAAADATKARSRSRSAETSA